MAEMEADTELSGDRAVSLLREPQARRRSPGLPGLCRICWSLRSSQGDILASVRVLKVFKAGPGQESDFPASLLDHAFLRFSERTDYCA